MKVSTKHTTLSKKIMDSTFQIQWQSVFERLLLDSDTESDTFFLYIASAHRACHTKLTDTQSTHLE